MADLSPHPATPQTADKAKVAATISGLVGAVLLAVALYYDGRNGTNFTEIVLALLGGAGTALATGVSTYKTRNKAKDANGDPVR